MSWKKPSKTMCLLSCVALTLSALATTKNHTVKPVTSSIFHQAPIVLPAGFRQLTAPHTTLVDVYYQNQLIGDYSATVSPGKLRFHHPQKLVNALPKTIDKHQLTSALGNTLATHSQLVCQPGQGHICQNPHPEVAAIVYNRTIFRVDLFINRRFIAKTADRFEHLPNSTAGLSYVNHFSAISDNSSGSDGEEIYNITTNNILAYKNGRFNGSVSFGNNIYGSNDIRVNALNYTHNHKQYQTTGGILETYSNSVFFSNQTILGGEFRTTLDTFPNAKYGLGSPLTIFLNSPSQVNVFKDGHLIYTGRYPAGNVNIDTRNFPGGSYPVTIRLSGPQGKGREINRFFVKSSGLTPLGLPQFYVSAGALMSSRLLDSGAITKLLPIPIVQAGISYRLTPSWGLGVDVIANDKAGYFSVGPGYIGHYYEFHVAGLIGTNHSYGYAVTLDAHYKKLYSFLNVTRIWHHKNFPDQLDLTDNQDDHYDTFLALYSLQLSATASYQLPIGALSFHANVNQSPIFETTYSYGPSYQATLFRYGPYQFELTLYGNINQVDRSIFGTVSVNYNARHFNGHGAIGYNDIRNRQEQVLSGSGVYANAELNYHHIDRTHNGYNVGVHGEKTPISVRAGGQGVYRANRFYLAAFASYNDIKNTKPFSQYGGTFDTRFAWTPQASGLGSAPAAGSSGVLVYINSPDANAKFAVYANNRLTRWVKANQYLLIPLNSFETYRIHIENASASLFNIAQPNRVVTLYPGNVKFFHWAAAHKLIAFGRLVDHHGHPINEKNIFGGIGINYTDSQGYFQMPITTKQHDFYVKQSKGRCYFSIKILSSKKMYVNLGNITCHLPRELHHAKHLTP